MTPARIVPIISTPSRTVPSEGVISTRVSKRWVPRIYDPIREKSRHFWKMNNILHIYFLVQRVLIEHITV